MMAAQRGELGGWRSRTTFVLALSAAAVGLGNIWRFAYLAGENGGGLFVLTYLGCLFFIAIPIMIAEVIIGSHGRGSPVVAIRWVADRSLLRRGWMLLGLLACAAGLLVLAYYIVVAGWALAYAWYMKSGLFAAASAAVVAEQFGALLDDVLLMVYWQSLFLVVAVTISALGVRRGLGSLAWLSVPAMLALVAALLKFGFDNGDTVAAREFLFATRPIDFTWHSVLLALGQALFTLGVGMGVGISYGAYAPRRLPVGRSVMAVAVFDTGMSLLLGVAIFPLVFANNMEPSAGPGLLFISLPYAFGNTMLGELFGGLFFLLVVLAALGSVVAIMEPIVGLLMQRLRIRRLTAALSLGVSLWIVGLLVALSFGPGEFYPALANGNLFRALDRVTADLLLPLVALFTAVLVGWRMRPEILRRELYRELDLFFSLWRRLLRYIAPPVILLFIVASAWLLR
ncbi:MAG: sodium-dependent transporter [Pseudomonadales bacterium]|nr:sodium-dependent transporter [Pseudomonadales bacterium]MCP5191206.1 sodium-dependent transporter [Pseudomonadales bacterium]MCP5203992.1 sodium-dependent transporter [Pseudomonadales bacterium]